MTQAYQIQPERVERSLSLTDFVAMGKAWPNDRVIEDKASGTRRLIQIQPNQSGQNYLTSRRLAKSSGLFVEKQDSMPQLRDWRFPRLLWDTVLDGEHCAEGDATMHMHAVHALAHGQGIFKVWDLLILRGADLRDRPLITRYQLLHQHAAMLPAFIRIMPRMDYHAALVNRIRLGEQEGVVIKDVKGSYDGRTWTKIKRSDTADVVILGASWSKAASHGTKGWIKGLLIGQWAQVLSERQNWPWDVSFPARQYKGATWRMLQVGQCSGFTNEVRARMSEKIKDLVGEVIAIEYETRLPSGKFQNPRYCPLSDGNLVRDDKGSHECLFFPSLNK